MMMMIYLIVLSLTLGCRTFVDAVPIDEYLNPSSQAGIGYKKTLEGKTLKVIDT